MVVLKNPRKVRLMDANGRFDLKAGETVTFPSVPKDLKGLVDKGILMEVKSKQKVEKLDASKTENLPAEEKAESDSSQKEKEVTPSKRTQGK